METVITKKCNCCSIEKSLNNFTSKQTYSKKPEDAVIDTCIECATTRINLLKNVDLTNPIHLKKYKNLYTPNESPRKDNDRYCQDIFGHTFYQLMNKGMLNKVLYGKKGKIHYEIKPEFAVAGKIGTTVPQETNKSISNNSKSKKMVQDKQDAPIASQEETPTTQHSVVEETSKISKSLEDIANEIHTEIVALSAEITNYSGKLVNLKSKFNLILAKIQEEKTLNVPQEPTEFSVEDFNTYFALMLDKGQMIMGLRIALKSTPQKDIKEIVVDERTTVYKFPTKRLKEIFEFAFDTEIAK